jgi:hypothetical protein
LGVLVDGRMVWLGSLIDIACEADSGAVFCNIDEGIGEV